VELVDLAAVRSAADLLSGVTRRTPVEHSRALHELASGPVWLKCENLQRTGSFKIRGAYLRLHRMPPEQRARGVVAASAGNHAQGVALAAALHETASTVFMPEGAALPKVLATRGYGADVRLVGSALADALVAATEFAERTGAVLVHPFDHPDLIAGQGTVGLEISQQVPEIGTVLVPTGGGGLLSGVAVAVRALCPRARIVGVQAAGAAAWPGSLAAGHPVPAECATIADGIAVAEPSPLTFAHVSELVDTVTTVSEEALSAALLHCLERAKLIVEPAGVAAVAALLSAPQDFPPPVVCVLSGGNIDPLLLLHVVQHGLAATSRYLSIDVRLADRPGALAALLTEIGSLGANVLDVAHSRVTGTLGVGEVQVSLALETRGAEHCAELLTALRQAGHTVTKR
jgi:threonine dehydratase